MMTTNEMTTRPKNYLVLSSDLGSGKGFFRTQEGDDCYFQNYYAPDIQAGDWIQCDISDRMHVTNIKLVQNPYWVVSCKTDSHGDLEIKGFLHKVWNFITTNTGVYVNNDDIGPFKISEELWRLYINNKNIEYQRLYIILRILDEPELRIEGKDTCFWEVAYCMSVSEQNTQSPPADTHTKFETAEVVKIMDNLILVWVDSIKKLAEITWSTNYNPTELRYKGVFECEVQNVPGRYSRFRVTNIRAESQRDPDPIEGAEDVSYDMELEIKLLGMRTVNNDFVEFDTDCGLVRIPKEMGTLPWCIGLRAYCSLLVAGYDTPAEDCWVVKKIDSYLIKEKEDIHLLEDTYPEATVYTSFFGRSYTHLSHQDETYEPRDIRQRVNGEFYIDTDYSYILDGPPPPYPIGVAFHAPTKYLVVKSFANQNGSTSGTILTPENQLLEFQNPTNIVIKANDWISCNISDRNVITEVGLVFKSNWIAHGKFDDEDETQITLTGNLEKNYENDEIVDGFHHVYHKDVGFIQVDQSHYEKASKTLRVILGRLKEPHKNRSTGNTCFWGVQYSVGLLSDEDDKDLNDSKIIRDRGRVIVNSDGCYEVWLKNLNEVAYLEGKEKCDFTDIGHQFECQIEKSDEFRHFSYKVIKIGPRFLEPDMMAIKIQIKKQKSAINKLGCPTFESDFGDVLVPPEFYAQVAPHYETMETVCYLKLWETINGWKCFWTVKEIDDFIAKENAPVIREGDFAVVLEDEDKVSGCFKVFTPLLGECKVYKYLLPRDPKIGDFLACKISQLPNEEAYISYGEPVNLFDKFNETSNIPIFLQHHWSRWKTGKLLLQADEYRIHEHNFFGLVKLNWDAMEPYNPPDDVIQIRNSMTPISVRGKENEWIYLLQKLQMKHRLFFIWERRLEEVHRLLASL